MIIFQGHSGLFDPSKLTPQVQSQRALVINSQVLLFPQDRMCEYCAMLTILS